MTNEEKINAVKEEISEFQKQVIRVSLLQTRLAELEDDINHPSISSGGSNVHGGDVSPGAARLVLIKSEVEEQLKIALNEYNDCLARVFSRMRKLPIAERIILEQRYVFGTPAKEIMTEMNISKPTYYDTLNRAYVNYYDIN